MSRLAAIFHRNREFVNSVATLMTGRSLAFVIGFAFVPIVARLFDPADFGRATLFISVVSVMGSISTLRLERAAVLPKNDGEGAGLIRLAVLALLALCAVLLLLNVAAWLFDFQLPLADRLGGWTWALPLGLAVFSLINIAEGWLVRKKQYRIMANTDVARATAMGGLRVAAGAAFGSSTWALIVAYLIAFGGRAAALVGAMVRSMPDRDERAKLAADADHSLGALGRQYKDFPLYNAPAGFVRNFSENLPVVMLGYLFAPAVVGFYAMANRIVRAPLGLASAAVRRVYLQRAATIHNDQLSLRGSLIKTTVVLAAIGIVPFGLLWLEGELLFRFVLGEKWTFAGRYAQILAPWLYSTWVISATGSLAVVLRKQALWLRMQIIITALRLAVFAYAYSSGATPEWTLQAFAAVSVAANAVIMAVTFGLVAQADGRRRALKRQQADTQ
ncbi:MAG: oligosaccharide flippase family protein [Pseudomonadota bacterium]